MCLAYRDKADSACAQNGKTLQPTQPFHGSELSRKSTLNGTHHVPAMGNHGGSQPFIR